jgi:DNA polymerase-3 subunit epsilon
MTTLLTRLFGTNEREVEGPAAQQCGLKKRLDLDIPIEEAEFTCFDTELTGLNLKHDSIISIGAVRLRGGRILLGEDFYRLVKPECELSCDTVVVHELTHTDLADADDVGDVLEDFLDFIGDSVLLGHFVYIDTGFVSRAMKRLFGVTLQNPAVDTSSLNDWLAANDMHFTRHFSGPSTKTDLFSMAKRYGIPLEKAHNSLYDALVTAQLFQRFMYFLPGAGVRTLKDLLAVGRP